jgi:hypothetical protein
MKNDEWSKCAREEYDKGNYYDSLVYMMKCTDFTSFEVLSMFAIFGTNSAALKAATERINGLVVDSQNVRVYWGLMIICTLSTNAILKMEKLNNYEDAILVLREFLKSQTIANLYAATFSAEESFSIMLAAQLIGRLAKVGLYNATFKVLDETSVFDESSRHIYIKEQWKPLYLAVKYLYQLGELQKQPSELSTPAFGLVSQMLTIP